jgi:histone acetyltransferase
MKTIVTEMAENPSAWPFIKPVSGVADYYEIIKEPMGKKASNCAGCGKLISHTDISTLTSGVENDEYKTLDTFVTDTNKIFNNCRLYNEEGREGCQILVEILCKRSFYRSIRHKLC